MLDTEEFVEGKSLGTLGEVLIRCNNVLFIRGAESAEGEEEAGRGAASGEDEDEQAMEE